MTTLMVMIAVGIGSYVLRALPVLLDIRVLHSPAVDRGIRRAATAALAALVAIGLRHSATDGLHTAAVLATAAAALAVAWRGGSTVRVVAAGGAAYAAVLLAAMAWTTPKPHVVIRRHRVRDVDLDDLVDLGTLDTALAGFLRAAIGAGKNIVVTGLQNAGKTTLIRALANEFAPLERFATIEKEYELHLHDLPERHPRVVAMEAREGSAETGPGGHRAGEVTLTDLVTDALRMNS